jgi:hypothetical protein
VKTFFVFMCPKCRNFTTAPVGQKRRRCSYCAHIIDISKAACAVFDTPEQASAAVREFNAARGGDEFEKAVERSRDRVRLLMPSDNIKVEDLVPEEEEPPMGKRSRLLDLLEQEAMGSDCTLDRLEQLCPTYQLEWEWVEEQLTAMSNSGLLIFPRPWSIRMVKSLKEEQDESVGLRDVTKEILSRLRKNPGGIRIVDLVDDFKGAGITAASVEDSLEKLMRLGDIFEPRPGHVQAV